LRMHKMPLTIIRPLCLCREDDIRQYAESHHYEKQIKSCPYESDTNRTNARDLFDHMQRLNPEARYCLWSALEAEGKLLEY
jgi:tRNA(Ile)-lysidine synthase TilS/MesJ